MTTKWWPHVESYLRAKYGDNCTISKPKNLTFPTPSGSTLEIEKTWYDVLVTDGVRGSHRLNHDFQSPHLIEVKFSAKGSQGSFGAFTIGEWIAAKWSLDNDGYTYEILYVWNDPDSAKTRIDELPLTEKLLEDMLLYPQVKLYFYTDLIQAHLPNASEPERPRRKRKLHPTMQSIGSAMRDALEKATR